MSDTGGLGGLPWADENAEPWEKCEQCNVLLLLRLMPPDLSGGRFTFYLNDRCRHMIGRVVDVPYLTQVTEAETERWLLQGPAYRLLATALLSASVCRDGIENC